MSAPEPTGRDALLAAIEELRQRVATVHERRRCPRCFADVGKLCHDTRRGARYGRPLLHPHPERLRADGIPDR